MEGSANEENLDESIIETIVGDEIDSGVFDQALDGATFKNEKVGLSVQDLIEQKRVILPFESRSEIQSQFFELFFPDFLVVNLGDSF